MPQLDNWKQPSKYSEIFLQLRPDEKVRYDLYAAIVFMKLIPVDNYSQSKWISLRDGQVFISDPSIHLDSELD